MIDRQIEHHVQKHIIGVLIHQKYARFRELRPPKIDTNLYSYHLKVLQKDGWVLKTDDGYTLSRAGLMYVDRVSLEKLNIRKQPKIVTMLVVQGSNGNILLQRRTKQPYVATWTLPYGKIHIDDSSVESAARREAEEKLGVSCQDMVHAGDCYIRVYADGQIFTATLAHVFYTKCDAIEISDRLQWVRPEELKNTPELAPAVKQIVERTLQQGNIFFDEYTEELALWGS
ncbi:MAG TPA: NUDIX hydrolase [Candidatus Saccharibacteria bacterium]|nr:NUDIX hydrolase [Candidatus Saccharibacteria bacterium]